MRGEITPRSLRMCDVLVKKIPSSGAAASIRSRFFVRRGYFTLVDRIVAADRSASLLLLLLAVSRSFRFQILECE